MTEVYVVDAVRTAVGKRNGGLADVHPVDLGASTIRSIMDRVAIDPAAIDDVIFGGVESIGGQAGNIARTSWLAAGYSDAVPGVTVDRQCGSSQQALHFGAQAIMSGTAEFILAGGVQNMSRIPLGAAMTVGKDFGFETPLSGSKLWRERYGDEEISQFHGAELIAEKWDLTRESMEQWALRSHERARSAIAAGRFADEIVAVEGCTVDECPRETSLEKMAALPPLVAGGRITAATSSQISDGASAVLLASEAAVIRHDLEPRARIHHFSVRGDDPILMLSAPIRATRHALARAGMTIDDIDLIEINEAFAPVVLAWIKDIGADPDKVNVNGGAIALGHPLAATGTKLFTTLLNELERRAGRFALQTICEGGGTANVTIIERV